MTALTLSYYLEVTVGLARSVCYVEAPTDPDRSQEFLDAAKRLGVDYHSGHTSYLKHGLKERWAWFTVRHDGALRLSFTSDRAFHTPTLTGADWETASDLVAVVNLLRL